MVQELAHEFGVAPVVHQSLECSPQGGPAAFAARRPDWARESCVAIFCCLHPQLFNGDKLAAANAFGIAPRQFRKWLSVEGAHAGEFVPSWFYIVQDMCWQRARACCTPAFAIELPW